MWAKAFCARRRRISSEARAVVAAKLGEELRVVARVDDDGEAGEILGRGPDHRRSADVDHLDGLRLVDAGAGDRAFERIEVHHHEVEGLDAVLRQGCAMRRLRAVGEDAAVDLRMQRLDAAVEDLGEAGDRRRRR